MLFFSSKKDFITLSVHNFIMRKLALVPIIIILVCGCVQDSPTGKFLQNQNYSSNDCVSSWNCTDWSECVRNDSYSGVQNRTCNDINSCQSDITRPQEIRVCGLPRITVKETAQMTLELSDLPKEGSWTVSDRNMISQDESTPAEKENGFQSGYYIHYISGAKHLYNYVSVYPLVDSAINMTYRFSSAQSYYRVGEFYEKTDKKIASISEIANPLLGDDSVAYNITVVNSNGQKISLYTICFTKWDVSYVLTLEGSNDYGMLLELAKKAEAKIG
jgi:hypothetical protein